MLFTYQSNNLLINLEKFHVRFEYQNYVFFDQRRKYHSIEEVPRDEVDAQETILEAISKPIFLSS
jgi:hypothetical protein